MSRIIGPLSSVLCDKAYDYASYYLNGGTEWEPQTNEADKLKDSVLDYKQTTHLEESEEKGEKRMFDTISYYEQVSVFFGPPIHICDNIYLGSAFNAADRITFDELNITTVINVSKEISNYFENEDIAYHRYHLYDNNKESIGDHLKEIYKKIVEYRDTKEGNILVHCYMGASRSATVVAYYLHKEKGYNLNEAINMLRSKRSIVNPTLRLAKDLGKIMSDDNI